MTFSLFLHVNHLILFKICSKCMKLNPTNKSQDKKQPCSWPIFHVKFPISPSALSVGNITSKHCNHLYAHAYLWVLAFPGRRSTVGSIGEGRRLKHEVKDWLESSLDTEHTTKTISSQFTKKKHHEISKWLAYIIKTFFSRNQAHLRELNGNTKEWHFTVDL